MKLMLPPSTSAIMFQTRITRRDFITQLAWAGGTVSIGGALPAWGEVSVAIPPHLKNYADLYRPQLDQPHP